MITETYDGVEIARHRGWFWNPLEQRWERIVLMSERRTVIIVASGYDLGNPPWSGHASSRAGDPQPGPPRAGRPARGGRPASTTTGFVRDTWKDPAMTEADTRPSCALPRSTPSPPPWPPGRA